MTDKEFCVLKVTDGDYSDYTKFIKKYFEDNLM